MYATLGHRMPSGPGWTYEPKYDGMRVIAEASSRQVRLMTRNGKDKQAQFPEVVGALRSLASRAGVSVVLDGEVVARRRRQKATRSVVATSGFQPLQARMHLKNAEEIARLIVDAPATLVAFDILREGRTSLMNRPWSERRERLEALFAAASDGDAALVLG
jgi:bifunctional non-homologous end joining protein LigD